MPTWVPIASAAEQPARPICVTIRPPIDRVSDHPTEERERDERDRLKETDEPNVERRAGEEVDLVGDRDEAQLRSGQGDELTEPHQPEGPKLAKRRDVDHALTNSSLVSFQRNSSRAVGRPAWTPPISWIVSTTRRCGVCQGPIERR